jgi:hypothetical protein
MFPFIFDNEIAFVRRYVISMHIPQDSDFIPYNFFAFHLCALGPNGGPVRHTTISHERVISEFHRRICLWIRGSAFRPVGSGRKARTTLDEGTLPFSGGGKEQSLLVCDGRELTHLSDDELCQTRVAVGGAPCPHAPSFFTRQGCERWATAPLIGSLASLGIMRFTLAPSRVKGL